MDNLLAGSAENGGADGAAAADMLQAETQYRAEFPYAAKKPDEISFVKGDILKCYKKYEDGWMEGRVLFSDLAPGEHPCHKLGKRGSFPGNFVSEIM